MKLMHELAQPFSFEGKGKKKNTCCLMVHGFTGSPAHLLELGKALNKKGYPVRSVLLRGHGTSPEDMETTGYDDWLYDARQALEEVSGSFEKVNLIGMSMGALLSLIIASENNGINKIVSMSAPILFRNWMIKLTPVVKFFKRFNEIVPPPVVEGESEELDIGYRKTPLKCAPHLIKVSKTARKSLPGITSPILIVQSHIDGQVNPESAEIIYNSVGSADKKILWLEKSKHIVTIGLERRFVEEEILSFLDKKE